MARAILVSVIDKPPFLFPLTETQSDRRSQESSKSPATVVQNALTHEPAL
jgi:hypothetical protein